jgi:hypothetical protein
MQYHTLGTERGTSNFSQIADSLNVSENGLIDTSQVLSTLLEQIGRTSKQHVEEKTQERAQTDQTARLGFLSSRLLW